MQRVALGLMLIALIGVSWYAVQNQKERVRVEQLLWVEFDASLQGMIRMLSLAEEIPTTALSPLRAAYEHGLFLQRLGPVLERILTWHGVRAEPLAGYLLSLTGGVGSICEQAHLGQAADTHWMAEIRQRLEAMHSVLNSRTMQQPKAKDLQQRIQGLFGSDTSVGVTPSMVSAAACLVS